MAFNDALFQLGMDLTRSSPAQKEEHEVTAHVVAHTAPLSGDASIERASGRFAGTTQSVETQVTIDVFGDTTLDNVGHVETTLARCIDAAGAVMQHLHLHPVSATGGVSGLAVLGNGHLSFHSRPTAGYAALEVTMLDTVDTDRWIAAARSAFRSGAVVPRVRTITGELAAPAILSAVLPPARRSSLRTLRVKAA